MAATKVTALCGFLGAGKTTSLTHLLENCPETVRIGVIANDVAKINIDAKLVQAVSKDTEGKVRSLQLDNGCACCTGSEDLVVSFEELMQDGAFDYIVIETTGVAEAGQMRSVLSEMPSVKAGKAKVEGIITVLDSNDFLHQYESRDLLQDRPDLSGEEGKEGKKMVVDMLVEQIESADVLVLNKIDLLEKESARIQALERICETLNPSAPTFTTSFGALDLLAIIGAHSKHNSTSHHHKNHHEDHKHVHKDGASCSHCTTKDFKARFGIDSFVFRSNRPFKGPLLAQNVLKRMAAVQQAATFPALEKIAGFLQTNDGEDEEKRSIEEDNPFANVLRSKGFLFLAGSQSSRKMYWSHAGRHFAVLPKGMWEEESPRQELVFIGVDMDKERILKLLEDSLDA